MMKTKFLTAAALTLAGSVAQAGSVAFVAPAAPEVMEEAGSMGGSGAWIIPLLAIALIVLALGSNQRGDI